MASGLADFGLDLLAGAFSASPLAQFANSRLPCRNYALHFASLRPRVIGHRDFSPFKHIPGTSEAQAP